MQEARVQVETKEPISGEIRACWFDLPIDTALFEEVLGIDAENEIGRASCRERVFRAV